MSRDALKTLFHPFETGVLSAPEDGQRWLFLGAEAGAWPAAFRPLIAAQQGLKPLHDRLVGAGMAVTPEIPEGRFDGALILAGKHKGENENRIAEALKRTDPGAVIVIAGGKEDGIKPLVKTLARLGLSAEHMPKYHGVAVWFERPADADAAIAALARPPVTIEGGFVTAPGMFSHERPDEGSELLASRLPTDFDGNAADLGAGWGYLSAMLAEKSPRVNRIDLFESDHAALEAAKANLARLHPQLQARYFWQDLAREEIRERYDLVIMNPPFHQGQAHAAEPQLGQAMIRAAHTALRGGGRLLMVANRGLPYETALSGLFRESGETCRNARFKVLWAKK